MEPITIILGFALLVCAGIVAWLLHARTSTVRSVEQARAEAVQATRERDLAEQRRTEDTAKLEGIAENLRLDLEKADARIRQLELDLSREQEQRTGDQKIHAERERQVQAEQTRMQNWIREREAELTDRFAKLSGEALDTNTKRFIEQAAQTFQQQMKQAEGDLEQRKLAVDRLVKPIGDTLNETRERLLQLAERVNLSTQASESLRTETGKLTKALSRPEIRGQYGEIQLRRVAEIAGMTSYCDFTEQTSTRDDAGRLLRPDMVVNLPNDRVIAIDAKTNTYAYLEAVNAETDDERAHHLDRFAKHVADQAKKLSDKKYWQLWEGSPDFVVMFVPGDHFIDAALQRDPGLIERAATHNVILASPATLIGLLRAVAVGWRDHALTEDAAKLYELGRTLHERAAVAFEHIESLGKALSTATDRYNRVVGSVESRLMPTLKRFEDAGAKTAKSLPELGAVTVLPRSSSLTNTANDADSAT